MKKLLTAALAVSVIASAGAAAAQPNHRDREARQELRGDLRDARKEYRNDVRDARRDYERRADRRYKAGRYNPPRGWQARHWRRGETLPPSYRGRGYVVSDWKRYHLAPPPRGYQYTRVGNDVVLTAIATGLVSSVILDLFN